MPQRSVPLRQHQHLRSGVLARAAEDASPSSASDANKVAEVDQIIDALLGCKSQQEFSRQVAEHILSFDQSFWMRLAARSDQADSDEERARLSSLATTVMRMVEQLVLQTEEQLTGSGEVVQEILRAGTNSEGQWDLPLSESSTNAMRQAVEERIDSIDEAFLSNCFAYIKKASDDGLDEIVNALQKILQLYASHQLCQTSPAGPEDAVLQDILGSDEQQWEQQIQELAEAGQLLEPAFKQAVQKKMEATVLGLASGSYAQRVQAEFLKELEDRGTRVYQNLSGV